MGLTQITTGGVDDNINIDNNTLKVDGTNNRVGIGTASPGALLDLGTSTPILRFSDTDTTGYHQIQSSNSNFIINADPSNETASSAISFKVDNSEAARIDSAGNIGIGTTSPQTITHVFGPDPILRIQDSSTSIAAAFAGIQLAESSSGGVLQNYWQIALEGDSGTSTDHLTFKDGTGERMRIDSSGNVGIGTTSPNSYSGYTALTLNNATTGSLVDLEVNDTRTATFLASATQVKLGSITSAFLRFDTNNTERMRITSDGKVGIGVTPLTNLDIAGSTNRFLLDTDATTAELKITNSAGSVYAGARYNASFHRFDISNSEKARIDSAGRLLVGTSSSINNLLAGGVQIAGTSSDAYLTLTRYSTNAGSASGIILGRSKSGTKGTNTAVANNDILGAVSFSGANGSSFGHAAQIVAAVDGAVSGGGAADMPGRLVFSTSPDGSASPTERMRITSAGYIFFNTTDIPSSSGYGSAFVQVGASGSRRTALYQRAEATSSSSIQAFYNPNGLVGSISVSGSSTAFNTSSDYRLKENITAVTDGITRLQQLKPSRFNFIADPDTTVDGFLAHEVQAVVPEAATGEKDAVDDEGNPEYQGIDQSKLVPLLTAALQEAIAKIETLETKVAALEAAE